MSLLSNERSDKTEQYTILIGEYCPQRGGGKVYSQYNNIPGYLKTLSPKRGQQVVFPINEKGTV